MNAAKGDRKVPFGVVIVYLVFLFAGVLISLSSVFSIVGFAVLGGLWSSFELLSSFFFVGWGFVLMVTALGLYRLKLWGWYLAVGHGILGIIRYFAIPYHTGQLPIELFALPYLILYLFLKRNIFFKRKNVEIRTWLNGNKFFILGLVVWVAAFAILQPFAVEGFTLSLNEGVDHQRKDPIMIGAMSYRRSDLIPSEDFYSLNIFLTSWKPFEFLHLTVDSEQGVCDSWIIDQHFWQTGSVEVKGGGTNQMEVTISGYGFKHGNIILDFWVSEGQTLDWQLNAEVKQLTPLWWIGMDLGALTIIIAWAATKNIKNNSRYITPEIGK